jgi:predicted protein tyrosine phosphatase
MKKKKLLFICTANVMRSPTAEKLFKDSKSYEPKSAGIMIVPEFPDATLVDKELVAWADEIFLMENIHLSYLKEKEFDLSGKKISVLDIPNIYDTREPDQREAFLAVLKEKLEPLQVKPD